MKTNKAQSLANKIKAKMGFCIRTILFFAFLIGIPFLSNAQETVDVLGNPEIVNATIGDNFSIIIQLDATGANVTVADIYMTFDPSVVQVNSTSFAPGSPFTISTFPPQAPDNIAGTWARGGFGFSPATSLVDYILVECTAVGSGTTLMEHVEVGLLTTTLAYAGENVTGQLSPIEINVSGVTSDCPELGVDNGDPCQVNSEPGEYVDCECLPYDCNGVPGGTAFLDNCGDCVGGSTGEEACVADCNGEFGGTAFLDNCGDCVGGSTGETACVADCNGEFGGTAFLDNCGDCVGGNTGETACVADCNGEFGGTAFLDNCGDCVGGSTGETACVADCNGEFGGTAFLDNCGDCVGGSTGETACVADCNGEFGGTAFLDNCGDCVGGSTGETACVADCNGEFGGTAFLDNCGDCVGGSTGETACVADCNGEFGGTAFLDNCGDCVGGSTGETACVADCNGEFGGTAFLDNCGDCVGGSTGETACVADCNGEFGGTATVDECGVCDSDPSNDNDSCTDCEGVLNGEAGEGSLCDVNTEVGLYNSDCECVPFPESSIEGSVDWNLACGSRSVTVGLFNQEYPEIIYEFETVMDANGLYETPLFAAGTYDVYVKVDGYLSKLYSDVIFVEGVNSVETNQIIPGDLNDSNSISITDISIINISFGTSSVDPDYNFLADYNCDGAINIIDFSLVTGNFGLSGEVSP